MSYVKSTDFAVKDSLLTGNPSKVVRGSEIDAEFNAIEAADAQNVKLTGSQTITGKAIDLASNTLTGTKAQFDTAVSDGNIVYQGDVITSLTGTKAQFDSACSDGNFAYQSDIGSSIQAYDADTSKTDVAATWTANQTPNNGTASVSTTSDYTFTGDDQVKEITFTNAITVTFAAPSGVTEHCYYTFKLKAGDTSARTFAWNSAYKFPAATAPLTSGTTTNGAFDIITFIGGASNTLQYVGHSADVR